GLDPDGFTAGGHCNDKIDRADRACQPNILCKQSRQYEDIDILHVRREIPNSVVAVPDVPDIAVAALATEQAVCTGATEQGVLAIVAVNGIIAGVAMDHVPLAGAPEGFARGCPVKDGVAQQF